MSDQAKAVVRRYYDEILNGRNLDAVGEFYGDQRVVGSASRTAGASGTSGRSGSTRSANRLDALHHALVPVELPDGVEVAGGSAGRAPCSPRTWRPSWSRLHPPACARRRGTVWSGERPLRPPGCARRTPRARPRPQLQLPVDAADVVLGGLGADVGALRDLQVSQSLTKARRRTSALRLLGGPRRGARPPLRAERAQQRGGLVRLARGPERLEGAPRARQAQRATCGSTQLGRVPARAGARAASRRSAARRSG